MYLCAEEKVIINGTPHHHCVTRMIHAPVNVTVAGSLQFGRTPRRYTYRYIPSRGTFNLIMH